MKKILITGFMPFDGASTNASWKVAQRAAEQGSTYADIVCEEIQVLWHDAEIKGVSYKSTLNYIKAAVAKHNPDCLICVGQAPGFHLEHVGRNEAIGDSDNANKTYKLGQRRSDTVPLHEGETYKYKLDATFIDDIDSFVKEYNYNRGGNELLIPSDDAGGYLCNLALYESLNNFSDTIPRIGFIHTMDTKPSINGAVQVIQMIAKKLYAPKHQELA